MNRCPFACLALFAALLTAAPAAAQPVKKLWTARHRAGSNTNYNYSGSIKTAADLAGNVVVMGAALDQEGRLHHYTAKYAAADGSRIWDRHYYDSFVDNWAAGDLKIDRVGDVILNVTYFIPGYDSINYTAKYAGTDGSVLWKHRNRGSGDRMVVDQAGNAIVSGRFDDGPNAGFGNQLRKYAAADGAILWSNWVTNDYIRIATIDAAGNTIVGYEYSLAKYAALDGRRLWVNELLYLPDRYGPYLGGVAVDSAGNPTVVGHFEVGDNCCPDDFSAPATDATGNLGGYSYPSNLYVAKFSPKGKLLWQKHPAVSGSLRDVAIDSTDRIISFGDDLRSDFIAKYAPGDGALLRKKRITGVTGIPSAVLDSSDNVVFAFNHDRGNRYSEIVTTKLASNGTSLWRQLYVGRGDRYDYVSDVTAGPGFVIVGGSALKVDGTVEFLTVKYADGATPQTFAAGDVADTTARLRGLVNPNTFATSASFEYGTDPALAAAIALPPIAIDKGKVAASMDALLTALNPLTTYYYRAIATANGQTTRGAIHKFTTLQRRDLRSPNQRTLSPRSDTGASSSAR